jgi:hypothetical protein
MRTFVFRIVLLLVLEGLASYVQSPAKRELNGDTSRICLGENRGPREHRASGILYVFRITERRFQIIFMPIWASTIIVLVARSCRHHVESGHTYMMNLW